MSGFNVGDRVVALYDFTKEQPEDMNVWSGDTLIIVDNNVGEGWVSAENPQTRDRGWVPAGYLQISATQRDPAPSVTSIQGGADPGMMASFDSSANYDDDDDFDSDDDFESDDVRGNKPRGSSTQKGAKGANILSRLAHTSGAAFTDYLSGVQTPFDNPSQTFQVTSQESMPFWPASTSFSISFGKRQDSSKFGSLKKFVVYAVTPSSTNVSVLRRYKHFDWLYGRLKELYPAIAIPALPDAKVTGHDDAFIRDREQKLLAWANQMSAHPVISQSEIFQHFITVSEKDEKKWKSGKRKAEKDPYKNLNSFLIFDEQYAVSNSLNSKKVNPALEAFCKYSNDVEKYSKHALGSSRSLASTYRGQLKSSYSSLGKSISHLGLTLKKGPALPDRDLIYTPDMKHLGDVLNEVGTTFVNIGDKFDKQTEKDLEVVENSLWVQNGTLEHVPEIVRMNKLASEACESKSGSLDESSISRLSKIQAATLAEVNQIQLVSPEKYKDTVATLLREQISFFRSLADMLEPHVASLDSSLTYN